jgi:hypothetical protein
MTWLPLLLADPSPCLRYQVLSWLARQEQRTAQSVEGKVKPRGGATRESDDALQADRLSRRTSEKTGSLDSPSFVPDSKYRLEVEELAEMRHSDFLVTSLVGLQNTDGSWDKGLLGDPMAGGKLQGTGWALARLAFLGFGSEHPAVQKGAQYLFSQQQPDGSWSLPRETGFPAEQSNRRNQGEEAEQPGDGYSMIPLQAAYPLRGLAAAGYARDPRCERAYDWLMAQRLPDGAWPTGIAGGSGKQGAQSGVFGYVAGYRRIAHSRWGCRSNTSGVLTCLALHPERRSGPEARRALDLLLGRETRERQALGFEAARLAGAERARGFISFYARFDLAFILWLCWRIGASLEDARIADMVAYVSRQCGEYGLWEYTPKPQVSRWVTFDLLRSLAGLDENSQKESGWISLEPRTPFQPYPQKRKRY